MPRNSFSRVILCDTFFFKILPPRVCLQFSFFGVKPSTTLLHYNLFKFNKYELEYTNVYSELYYKSDVILKFGLVVHANSFNNLTGESMISIPEFGSLYFTLGLSIVEHIPACTFQFSTHISEYADHFWSLLRNDSEIFFGNHNFKIPIVDL